MKILLGVINKLDSLDVNSTFKNRLRDLTDFWIYNATSYCHLNLTTLYFTTEQECIDYGNKHGFNIVIGSALGHLLRPGTVDGRNVLHETVNLCKNSDGLVGHIMAHPGKIPYLYDEYWCLNLDVHRELNTPKWEVEDNSIYPAFGRSVQNFHSDYTPYHIGPGLGDQFLQNKEGTGLIKAWLESGKTIKNFPQNIRKLKHHLYPEHHIYLQKYFNEEIEVDDLQQELQLKYFRQVDYRHSKDCIFLFNTDITNFITPERPIDNLVTVCAAFRPYLILYKSGFNAKTTVKFVDYSSVSLQFKEWLLSNWDGKDILDIRKQFENQIGRSVTWNKPFHMSYEESYEQVIAEFGGLENWLEFWNRYRHLPHEFHCIDLVEETEKVSTLLGDNKNYLYISNTFNTEAGLVKHGKRKLTEQFEKIVKIGLKFNSVFDGSDPNHNYPNPDYTVNLIKKFNL